MFSEKITKEERSKAVSDRIFERAQQDVDALIKLRQSNPCAVPPIGNSFSSSSSTIFSKKMTREEMEREVSNRIFKNAAQDTETLSKISSKQDR